MTAFLHWHRGKPVVYELYCPYEYTPADPCPACGQGHTCGEICGGTAA